MGRTVEMFMIKAEAMIEEKTRRKKRGKYNLNKRIKLIFPGASGTTRLHLHAIF